MTDTPEQAARRAELAQVVELANAEIDALDAPVTDTIAADKAKVTADEAAGTGTADDLAALQTDAQNESRGRVRG